MARLPDGSPATRRRARPDIDSHFSTFLAEGRLKRELACRAAARMVTDAGYLLSERDYTGLETGVRLPTRADDFLEAYRLAMGLSALPASVGRLTAADFELAAREPGHLRAAQLVQALAHAVVADRVSVDVADQAIAVTVPDILANHGPDRER